MATTKQFGGILGLVMLIAGFGGGLYVAPDDLSRAWVCNASQKIGMFDRVSSTAKTAYYVDAVGVERRVSCTGVWVKLVDYAKLKGVDPRLFLSNINVDPLLGATFECSPKLCVEVD
jgi:hypothetical protein